MKNKERLRVIVIGGGFGGCAVTKALAKHDIDITLIDKRNHHVFQPLLYQVATAILSPAEIAHPIRSIFRKNKNVTVLIGNVVNVDTEAKTLMLKRSERVFEYDYLIVAAGARHAYFGNDDWAKFAWGVKTTRDALQIRERILYTFEKAERTRKDEKRARYLNFVIVGGGPTGVEMAGAIAEMTNKTMVGDFRNFCTKNARIILVEGQDRLLSTYPPTLSERAKQDLEKMGVEVRVSTFTTGVSEEGVQLGDEFIPSENVIWAAGNQASPLIKCLPVDTTRSGQAKVSGDFSLPNAPNVFCIGDCAFIEDGNDTVVPAVAQGAKQAGHFVARQIIRDLNNKDREVFCYKDRGSMATIGKSKAVAVIGGMQFKGLVAWILWSVIHVFFLIDFRSKLIVFFHWSIDYFSNKRPVRLINFFRAPQKGD